MMVAVKRKGKEKSLVTSNKFNILSREVNECIISHREQKGELYPCLILKTFTLKFCVKKGYIFFLLTPFFGF